MGGGPEDLCVGGGKRKCQCPDTRPSARGAPCLSVRERNPFAERKATMGCYPRNASSERCPFFCEHSGRIGCLPIRKSPWSVPDSHATLRRSQTRFDSWRGHLLQSAPRECVGCTAVFEAARPGSIPGRGTRRSTSCPRGVPDSHTTLRRSRTRFNSWRGHCF